MARARTRRKLSLLGILIIGVASGVGIGMLLVRLLIEN